MNGFSATGIFLFNPEAVLEDTYLPSALSKRPDFEAGYILGKVEEDESSDTPEEVTVLEYPQGPPVQKGNRTPITDLATATTPCTPRPSATDNSSPPSRLFYHPPHLQQRKKAV